MSADSPPLKDGGREARPEAALMVQGRVEGLARLSSPASLCPFHPQPRAVDVCLRPMQPAHEGVVAAVLAPNLPHG